jgi:hypothetical protein
VSMKTQRADVKKALGSVHNMNVRGNAVGLGGSKSYTQNKYTGQKTRIDDEGGKRVMYLLVPSDRSIKDEE